MQTCKQPHKHDKDGKYISFKTFHCVTIQSEHVQHSSYQTFICLSATKSSGHIYRHRVKLPPLLLTVH